MWRDGTRLLDILIAARKVVRYTSAATHAGPPSP